MYADRIPATQLERSFPRLFSLSKTKQPFCRKTFPLSRESRKGKKMISNKFKLSGFLNRKSKLVLLILALSLVPVVVISVSVFNVFAQADIKKDRKFTKIDLGREPVEIVEIDVKGKVAELNSSYLAGDHWLEGTAIKFKNISNKTITYVNFGIDVKQEGTFGFLAGDNLIYGFRPDGKELKRDEGRSLASGDVAKVFLSSRSLGDIKKLLSGDKSLKDLNLAYISLLMVMFDDGTKWSGGRYFRPDPDNPGKFIAESNPN